MLSQHNLAFSTLMMMSGDAFGVGNNDDGTSPRSDTGTCSSSPGTTVGVVGGEESTSSNATRNRVVASLLSIPSSSPDRHLLPSFPPVDFEPPAPLVALEVISTNVYPSPSAPILSHEGRWFYILAAISHRLGIPVYNPQVLGRYRLYFEVEATDVSDFLKHSLEFALVEEALYRLPEPDISLLMNDQSNGNCSVLFIGHLRDDE